MTSTNELLALQHRKNRKTKSQIQASQEMVNAFDKISVSVRRAYNVNRCQQDHLDNKVWTLENEYRKSMGLLALEQKRFIQARKTSNVELKPDLKHRRRRKQSSFSVLTKKDSLKTSIGLPMLTDTGKFQSEVEDSVKNNEGRAFSGERVVGSKSRKPLQKQDNKRRIHMSSIHETQMSKAEPHKDKDYCYQKQSSVGKWMSRTTGVRTDTIDKQQYIASWDISASKVSFTETDKTYNLNTPLLTSCQLHSKRKENISRNDHVTAKHQEGSPRNSKDTEKKSRQPLLNKKFHLIHSGTNSTSELESLLDRTIEIRVKEFLKLPPIGGIHERPSHEHKECNSEELPPESHLESRPCRTDRDTSYNKKHRTKSSLWNNLVHCRYLRLGEQRVSEHKITNKNCECNWCAMMRKSKI